MPDSRAKTKTLHASCVSVDGRGLLITGRSGSGKSDLALRLVALGAALVADDQTCVTRQADILVASPPAALKGMIEARGQGLFALPFAESAQLVFSVNLDRAADDRLPLPSTQEILGVVLPEMPVNPFETSASAKLLLALRHGLPHSD